MDEEPYLADGDLKPCPFCGHDTAEVSKGTQGPDQRGWWYIECASCSASANSVEDWNQRAPQAEGDATDRTRLDFAEKKQATIYCSESGHWVFVDERAKTRRGEIGVGIRGCIDHAMRGDVNNGE